MLQIMQNRLHNLNSLLSTFLIFIIITVHMDSQIIPIQTNKTQVNDNTITSNQNQQLPTFDEFIKIYQKIYQKDSQQYFKRKIIYEERVKKLKQMQADRSITYIVGVSQFSDQTQQQRQKRKPLLVETQKKTTSDEDLHKLSQSAAGKPISLDWRQSGVVTSIKDQGSCGACWTFATAAYGESRLILNKTKTLDIDLSEQYLLSCTPDCSCGGGYLEYVFQKAAEGVPLQSQQPYNPYSIKSPFICWSNSKIYFGYYPQKYYDISDNQLKNLLQSGPVAISISANNWQQYKGGVFSCKSYDKVNHAVLLVGYTPTYWIIKNQWGTKWGQQGYIRVSTDPKSNCKIGTSAFIMWETYQSFLLFLVLAITLCLL